MLNINFSSFPNLKTTRLVLRQLILEDKNEIFFLRSDQIVNQYLDRDKAYSIEDAEKFIEKITSGYENNGLLYWAVISNETSKLIGTICYFNFSKESSSAEVGFELLPAYHGKGIISEALTAVLNYGFEIMKLKEIDAVVHKDNLKSIKLLEKNNFVRVSKIKENYSAEEIEKNMLLYQLEKNTSLPFNKGKG